MQVREHQAMLMDFLPEAGLALAAVLEVPH